MIAIAIVFVFGLATTVILSLRSPEVKVPDVIGKGRFEAERVLGDAGLNFRIRATRPSREVEADVVLFQLPRAGEMVKAGQTVAMDISRAAKEGETAEATPDKSPEVSQDNKNANEAAANENKPKPNRNANKNGNENVNANANANRNLNANRLVNRNVNNSNANANVERPANANVARPPVIINNNANRAPTNANVRPPAPRPTATVPPN